MCHLQCGGWIHQRQRALDWTPPSAAAFAETHHRGLTSSRDLYRGQGPAVVLCCVVSPPPTVHPIPLSLAVALSDVDLSLWSPLLSSFPPVYTSSAPIDICKAPLIPSIPLSSSPAALHLLAPPLDFPTHSPTRFLSIPAPVDFKWERARGRAVNRRDGVRGEEVEDGVVH